MSVERKTVEEKLKRDNETLPLEELTLAGVGMDIPHVLAAGGRWLPTDFINIRKLVTTDGIRQWQTILCDALHHGCLDYAAALIGTYRRKDIIGLNPNIPGSFIVENKTQSIFPINFILQHFKKDARPSLALLINEIIQAGAFLSHSKSREYLVKNRTSWNLPATPAHIMMALDYIIDCKKCVGNYLYLDTIPLENPITPIVKQFFVNLQFYTESPIRNKPEVKSIEQFKKMVDEAIPHSQKMSPAIFNLICEYIPFASIVPIQETTYMHVVSGKKECGEKIFEVLEIFLREQFEEYQKEQRELQKLEVERMNKEEEERQRQELSRLPSEIRSLKALVTDLTVTNRKQSEILKQNQAMMKNQQNMIQDQGKQLALLTSMLQQFMMRDRAGSAAGVLSAIPETDSFSDHFEIELDGTLAKTKDKCSNSKR